MYTLETLAQKERDTKSFFNRQLYATLQTIYIRTHATEELAVVEELIPLIWGVDEGDINYRAEALSKIGFFRRELENTIPGGWTAQKPRTWFRFGVQHIKLAAIKNR